MQRTILNLETNEQTVVDLTPEEIAAEAAIRAADEASKSYAEKRAREYPPITDWLDGMVKGDQAQMQAYVDACLAVKAKYPKPVAGDAG